MKTLPLRSLAGLLLLVTAATVQAQSCRSGAACIAPTTTGNARATTDGGQDVVVGQTMKMLTINPLASTTRCRVAGASECVSPMAGNYVAIPYPQVTALAMTFDPVKGVTGNWTTANAIGATMVCANTATAAVAYNGPVPTLTSPTGLPGSSTWPAGKYVCTLTAQNSVGRTASQSTIVQITGSTLAVNGFAAQIYGVYTYEVYPQYGNYMLQRANWTNDLLSWTASGATSSSMVCSQTQTYNFHRDANGHPSGDGQVQGFEPLATPVVMWSGNVPNVGAFFKVPGSDGWGIGIWACTLTATDGNGGQASATATWGNSPDSPYPQPHDNTTVASFYVQGTANNAVAYWTTTSAAVSASINCSSSTWDNALSVPLQSSTGYQLGVIDSSGMTQSFLSPSPNCALRAYSGSANGLYGPAVLMQEVTIGVKP